LTELAKRPKAIARSIVIKTLQEVELMRQAGKINAQAIQEVSNHIRPGVTTASLDAIAETVIRDSGGSPAFKGYPGPYPYPATINASVNAELVHGIPGKRVLQSGDIITIDCGTLYQGFYVDSAATFPVGEISPDSQNLLGVTQEALREGIEQMYPGNRVGDISAAIQHQVEVHGYFLTREYTGHGIGQQMHEAPSVLNVGKPGRGLTLRSGLVIALEPMVLVGTEKTYVLPDQWTVVSADGSLTAHFEHTVAITADGPEILTGFRD